MRDLISWVLSVTLACSGIAAASPIQECNEATEPEIVAVEPGTAGVTSARADQVIYKGVIGNLLETVPLDPARRVELQRTNAVVSNPLAGRSLALLLGVASPILMIGGLIWGLFSASQIDAPVGVVSDKPHPPVGAASGVMALD